MPAPNFARRLLTRALRPRPTAPIRTPARPPAHGVEALEDRTVPALLSLDAGNIGVATNAADSEGAVDIAVRADGSGFVVVYQAPDASNTGIFFQRYDANWQAVGGAVPVNTVTANIQDEPAVGMDAAGNFVVTWNSRNQAAPGLDVYARRFNADGTAVDAAEFVVNSTTTGDQFDPDVGVNAAGRFVIAYRAGTFLEEDIFAKGYTSITGTLAVAFADSPVSVPANSTAFEDSDQNDPVVALDTAGNFVVAYDSPNQAGGTAGTSEVVARRMNADGTPNGGEFIVNSTTAGGQGSSDVAIDGSGNFVIVFTSSVADADGVGVLMQRYDSSGVAQGGNTLVNTAFQLRGQAFPRVAAASGGDFVVTWHSEETDNDNNGTDSYYKKYNSAGGVLIADTIANAAATQADDQAQEFTAIGITTSGDFVVAWEGTAGAARDVFLRRFAEAPVIQYAAATSTPAESAGAVNVAVTRTGAQYTLANLTSTAVVGVGGGSTATGGGTDYSGPTPTGLTFSAATGVTSQTLNTAVTIIDDAAVEPTETVVLTLGSPTNATVGAPGTHTLTIQDNDGGPDVSVTATDADSAETTSPAAANPGQFTVTRSGATGSPLTVFYTASGTATNGTDYATLSGAVTIPAGQASATIDVTALNDALTEGDETVVVTLTPDPSYALAGGTSATVTIADNEPEVSVTATDASAAEGAANPGQFTVTRTGGTTAALVVNYAVSGTASNGTDYALLSGSVTIPAGLSSAVIDVTVLNDALVEGDETVVVTLAAGAYTLADPTSATVTVADSPGTLTAAVVGNDLVVADTAGDDNALTVRLVGGGTAVEITDATRTFAAAVGTGSSGGRTLTVPLAAFTGKLIFNTAAGADTLTVDQTTPIPRAIDFAGGDPVEPTGDTLVVTGGTFATVTHTLTGSDAGTLQFSGGAGTITYTGLEPVDMTGTTVGNLVFNLPGTASDAVLEDAGAVGDIFSQLRSANGTFETTAFANPTGSLTINRGNAADTLRVNALPDFTAALTAGAAGAEFATVDFAGAVTLAAGASLSVTATGTINFSTAASDIATSGTGTITLTSAREIALQIDSSLTTTAGDITLTANRQATPTAGSFIGVELRGAAVTSAGGAVVLRGRGGDTGDQNYGVLIYNGAAVSSTAAGGAGVTVDGVGGGGDNFAAGVLVAEPGTVVSSAGGPIQITGVGGVGTGAGNAGIAVTTGAAVRATGTATVTLDGTGGGTGAATTQNYGVDLFSTPGNVPEVTAVDGAITITGTAGPGADSVAVAVGLSGVTAARVATTGAGTITLIGDTIQLEADAVVDANARQVTVRPKTAGVGINLGTETAGALSLTAAELATIRAGVLVLGAPAAGAITVSTPIALAAAAVPRLELVSGGAILDGNAAAGADLTVAGLGLTAAGGIGTAADPLETQTAALSVANTAAGDVRVVNLAGDLSVAGGNAAPGGVVDVTNPGGKLTVVGRSQTVASADVPRAIPDLATVTSTLVVAGVAGAIADLDVTLTDLPHTSAGDLTIVLISPGGVRVELTSGNGGLNNDYLGTVFDDEAATSVTLGSAPFTGRFRPEGSLSAFDGLSPNGTWVLEITDTINGDVGTLNAWSLTFGLAGLAAAGPVTLSADDIDLLDRVDAGAGVVTLRQAGTAARPVDLGTETAGALGLTDAELGRVTAGVLRVGRADNPGDISITAAITPHAGYDTLSLASGGGVSAANAAGTIAVANLAVRAAGPVDLSLSATVLNAVGTVAANVTGAGAAFAFNNNASALTVGTADGVSGVTTNNGGVTVRGNGDIAAAAAVGAGTGGVVFQTGGGRRLTNQAAITGAGFSSRADEYDLQAGSTITVNGEVNLRANTGGVGFDLGSTALGGGTIHLSQAELDTLTAPADLRLTSAADVNFSQPIVLAPARATLLVIEAVGAVTDGNAAGADLTAGAVAFKTGTGVDLDTAVGTLAFTNAAGPVGVRNTGELTVGALFDVSTSRNLGTTTAISAASPLTIAVNTTSAGNLTLTASETADAPTFADVLTVDAGVTAESTGGDLTLNAGDDVVINGTAAAAGTIFVNAGFGDLDGGGVGLVNGTAAGTVVATGTLGGTGTVTGALTVTPGGTVTGGAVGGVGTLATGDLTLTGTTYAADLAAAASDRLAVTGTVTLGGATLTLAAAAPTPGQPFTLIDNDGADAVTGTFAGLAEGATLTSGGVTFRITYAGGDGNDVVLTSGPFVSVAATDAAAGEVTPPAAPNPGRFTVTRIGDTTNPLVVSYTVGGTATAGADFAFLSGVVTIPAGSSSAAIDVTVLYDALIEGDESVIVTLTADPSYALDAPTSATVVIADNPATLSAALVGADLVVTDLRGVANALTVRLVNGGADVEITDAAERFLLPAAGTLSNGDRTLTVPLAAFTGKLIVNTAAGADTLTVDQTAPLPRAIDFDGGADADALVVTGGTFATVTHTLTGPASGNLQFTGAGTITYTGLEPVDMTGTTVGNLVFNLPAAASDAVLEDAGAAGDTFSQLRSDNGTFETTAFANPTGSLTINRGNTADTLTVTALPDFAATLTVGAAGAEFATVDFAGAVTLAAGSSLSVTATGTILLSTAASDIATSGTGTITLTTARDIVLNPGSSLTTADGGVTLSANQQAAPTAGGFRGILLDGASITTTGAGNVRLLGRGGDDAPSSDHTGITLDAGTLVESTGTGTVTLTGTGGATTDRGYGVNVQGSLVRSATGAIAVTGVGSAAATGDFAAGVRVGGTGRVVSTGTAPIAFDGTGGTGSGTSQGVRLTSTAGAVASAGGAVVVTGRATNATGADNFGVFANAADAVVTTGAATLAVTGTAAPGFAGIQLTGAASMTLAGAATFRADGMDLLGAAGSVTGGSITLTPVTAGFGVAVGGTAADTATALGLGDAELDTFAVGTLRVTTPTGTLTVSGDITRAGGALALDAADVTGAGNVAPGAALAVAVTGTASALTGVISGPAATVTKLGTGTLALAGANTYTGATTVAAGTLVVAGTVGPVTVAGGTLTGTGTVGAVTATAGAVVPGATAPTGPTVLSAGNTALGAVTFAPVIAGTPGGGSGALAVAGTVSLAGTALAAARTGAPVEFGQVFTLIANDGSDPVVGTFAGLIEGATVVVDGQNFRLSYAGGDGNDVTLSAPTPTAAVGTGGGGVLLFTPTRGGVLGSPAAVSVFPGSAATTRATTADVDGDGIPDLIATTGPGAPVRVAVVSGADRTTVLVPAFDPFGGDFAGGAYVTAADLDGDGRAEFAVTPDLGGGPRVVVFGVAGGKAIERASFFGIADPDFRGGARAALGDVNGDGVPDLAVAAGFLGGPRAALYDGTTLFGGAPAKLVGDFFAFPGTDVVNLRNGAFVTIGDLDGDGFGDLIFGGGPGGAPRVFALSGARLLAGGAADAQANPLANFFVGGNDTDRAGARVAATDLDADARADLMVGTGTGTTARVRAYLGIDFTGTGEPAAFQDVGVSDGIDLPGGGVFVGG